MKDTQTPEDTIDKILGVFSSEVADWQRGGDTETYKLEYDKAKQELVGLIKTEIEAVLDRFTQHGYLLGGGKEYVPISREDIEAEKQRLTHQDTKQKEEEL